MAGLSSQPGLSDWQQGSYSMLISCLFGHLIVLSMSQPLDTASCVTIP